MNAQGWWLIGLSLVAGNAAAQAVHKCATPTGVAYQSTPCAGRTLQSWEHAEQVAVPGAALERAEADRRIAQARKSIDAGAGPRTLRVPRQITQRVEANRASRKPRASDCARARAARAAAHEKRGVRWSFDDASRWDAQVFKVCHWG